MQHAYVVVRTHRDKYGFWLETLPVSWRSHEYVGTAIMSRISVSSLERYPVPLASVLAVAAAVFMITVWAPIQQRSLSAATRIDPTATIASRPAWLDTSFTTTDGLVSSLSASNGR